LQQPRKKGAQQLSAKKLKNSLELSQPKPSPKPFERKKATNVLDRAQALCKIANEDFVAMVDQQAQDPMTLERFRHDFWYEHPGASIKDIENAYTRHQAYAKLEHLWLKQQLDFLIDNGKLVVPPYVASPGPSGRTVVEPVNIFQALVDDLLRDSRIDLGRFARCEICRKFFYKARDKSKTCSRRCENILVARQHYATVKQNRAQARELHSQGKNAFQIAHDLDIPLAKVRDYLKR
jgi:hypothetical protein